jgi:hypothetical protein
MMTPITAGVDGTVEGSNDKPRVWEVKNIDSSLTLSINPMKALTAVRVDTCGTRTSAERKIYVKHTHTNHIITVERYGRSNNL